MKVSVSLRIFTYQSQSYSMTWGLAKSKETRDRCNGTDCW